MALLTVTYSVFGCRPDLVSDREAASYGTRNPRMRSELLPCRFVLGRPRRALSALYLPARTSRQSPPPPSLFSQYHQHSTMALNLRDVVVSPAASLAIRLSSRLTRDRTDSRGR